MRARAACVALAAALAVLACGCTSYHYIVRTEDAPLYAGPERGDVIARMERLAEGYIGKRAPEGDPVEVEYDGLTGWADRKDLRIFGYPAGDAHARWHAIFESRRDVILEGKDWPDEAKAAIRSDRVENGMTREMVRLAWGRPDAVDALEGGGERWTWERTRFDVYEHVHYDWYPARSRFAYGYGPWGPSFAYGYDFAYLEPHYYRTYYPRTERRTVTFGPGGTVTGWERTSR